MADLKGRFDVKVDAKGRVSVPSKCRRLLPYQLVVSKHPNKNRPALVLYPEDTFSEWFDSILESLGGAKANDPVQEELVDEFFQFAADVEPDDLGRIIIPTYLREYAGIKGNAVITGARDHLIIRTPEVLEEACEGFASNSIYHTPAPATAESTSDRAATTESTSDPTITAGCAPASASIE